jgi:hypothetical protein
MMKSGRIRKVRLDAARGFGANLVIILSSLRLQEVMEHIG